MSLRRAYLPVGKSGRGKFATKSNNSAKISSYVTLFLQYMKPPSLSHLASVLIIAPLGLASCGKPQEDPVAAAQAAEALASLQASKARVEKEMKLLKADFEKRQAEVIHKNEDLMKSSDSLKSQFEKAQDEAAQARRDLEAYMAKYRASLRAKAKGMALPQLETLDKAAFERVVIKELTPTEVAFSHSGGIGRIPLAKLTPDLQKKLLYDAAEVKAMEAEAVAGAEAVNGLKDVAGVKMRDPSRPVNPIAVRNLTQRIVSRQAEILNVENEAKEVKKSLYANTNIAQYRVKQLGLRVAHLNKEIAELRALLDKELNGPPNSAVGPPKPPSSL
jgi:hypothetical protein